jgi:hypothetical protein
MNTKYLVVATFATFATSALAAPYNYAAWASSTSSSAVGTVGTDAVTFSGPLSGLLTNYAGGYYDDFPSDYISSTVSNAPATTDNFIQLVGGPGTGTYTLTLTTPVNNLVVSVLSLGGGSSAQFNFDKSFTILSQGPDQWGGSNTSLTQSGDDLVGTEGSGSILFAGSTQTLTWTLPTAENWYGFTVAAPAAVPEPSSIAILGVGALGLLIRRKRTPR